MTQPTKDIHERLVELLSQQGATYRVVAHVPEGRTELIAQIRGNRLEQAIKSMVVQVRHGKKDNRYYLANVPGDCRVDFEAIRAAFEADSAAFAPRARAEALAGCLIGSIPPFSFNDDLVVLADPGIQQNEEVVFNAGRLDRSIFMKMEDYIRIARPRLLKIAVRGSAGDKPAP
jgi:Ala-tRNA(Pro) deacylase